MGAVEQEKGAAGVNTDHAELLGTILPGKSHSGAWSSPLMQCLNGCLRNEVDKGKMQRQEGHFRK